MCDVTEAVGRGKESKLHSKNVASPLPALPSSEELRRVGTF